MLEQVGDNLAATIISFSPRVVKRQGLIFLARELIDGSRPLAKVDAGVGVAAKKRSSTLHDAAATHHPLLVVDVGAVSSWDE